jgi:mannosylglucosylglycerate synthase
MNVFILGYRVAGLDGVSLETVHWKKILERMGHTVTLVAGELDREGIVMPELHFKWPRVAGIHDRVVYSDEAYNKVEKVIFSLAGTIEGKLRSLFRNGASCDLLIVPNVFSIPMHFPLAVALTRTISEFSLPTIARHHDFWWERVRYQKSDMFHFFEDYFPPKLPSITHTVINSLAQKTLEKKFGIKAPIIADTFDFEDLNLAKPDDYSNHFRRDFKIEAADRIFLQATRIVKRKRIEISIDLLAKLGMSETVFVIGGNEGDEQKGYLKMLKKLAREKNIRCLFIGERVNSQRKIVHGKRIYTLWDCYLNADVCTYPTMVEGFGNQFLEAVYFKKPLILTPYPVYQKDIKPLGFEVIEITPEISDKSVDFMKILLSDDDTRTKMVEKNFALAKKHFSYSVVEEKLNMLFKNMGL